MFDNLFKMTESDPSSDPRRRVENLLGEIPEVRDASRLVKPAGLKLLAEPAIYHFRKARAWMIMADADSDDEAKQIGQRVQRSLVGKKSLTSADPYVACLPLFVAFEHGHVELPGEVEKSRDTGKSNLKYKILYQGQSVFGKQGCKLVGHEGDYQLEILPARKEFRGKFAAAKLRAPTLEEISAGLSKAIEQIQHLL